MFQYTLVISTLIALLFTAMQQDDKQLVFPPDQEPHYQPAPQYFPQQQQSSNGCFSFNPTPYLVYHLHLVQVAHKCLNVRILFKAQKLKHFFQSSTFLPLYVYQNEVVTSQPQPPQPVIVHQPARNSKPGVLIFAIVLTIAMFALFIPALAIVVKLGGEEQFKVLMEGSVDRRSLWSL